jgi:hypothetical protein
MTVKIDHGRVEFLGIEIIFTEQDDSRGSVWIPFSETLTLLYGKNGVGKSTILRAIASFIRGESLEEEGMLIHGYARVTSAEDTCNLMTQALEDMPEAAFLHELEGLSVPEINDHYGAMAEGLELPFRKWENSLFGPVPQNWEDLDMNWAKFVSHFIFLGLWENDIRHDFPPIKNFIHHLIDERTFCLIPCGSGGITEWKMTLAANISNEETKAAIEYVLDNPELNWWDGTLDNPIAEILQTTNILANRSDLVRTNSPYVSASRIDGRKISSIGMSVVDLNTDFDIDAWAQRRMAELVHSSNILVEDAWFPRPFEGYNNSPTAMFTPQSEEDEEDEDLIAEEQDSDEEQSQPVVWFASFGLQEIPIGYEVFFEFDGVRKEILQTALSFIARELPDELGISDLRLQIQTDLGLWIFGQAGVLEAFDLKSNNWIAVGNTSDATQKIIGMALRIHSEVRSTSIVNVVLGDEIDQGLHTLAVQGLYKMLDISVPLCFVTSHSAIALSSRLGERLHVHRGARGELLLDSITSSDLAASSASQLGLRVNELIGMVDIVVAVEGLHDKMIFEHFAKIDDRLSHRNILFVSMGGLKNASNLLDIDFILSYSDLQIVVIADNTSKTELIQTLDSVTSSVRSGESSEKLARGLRARSKELQSQHWYEQYCMFDLLARATERELLSRIRMGGHIYFDIEAALPFQLFELPKDWDELESEYRAYAEAGNGQAKNFKGFLRQTHNVSIDQRTIKKALDELTAYPAGIQMVMNDIANAIEEVNWY